MAEGGITLTQPSIYKPTCMIGNVKEPIRLMARDTGRHWGISQMEQGGQHFFQIFNDTNTSMQHGERLGSVIDSKY